MMQLQPTTVCVRSGWTDAAKDNITYRYDGSYALSQRSALTDHWQGRTLRTSLSGTLPASLSGTFLQTSLPHLVTPLKGHSLSPRSRKDVVNQCLEFGKDAAKADNIATDHDGSHVLSVDAAKETITYDHDGSKALSSLSALIDHSLCVR